MDEEFLVTRFIKFHNDVGYLVSYQLPSVLTQPEFGVGDPAPIFFWHAGEPIVIEGDSSKEALVERFGRKAMISPVLADLGRMLDDARSGQFRLQKTFREADDMRTRFGEVFYDPPVRSWYWVSRYRRALAYARKVATPPHPIDRDLRRAAREWLKKFGTKCDIFSLRAMLGSSTDGVFSGEEFKDILYAYFVNAIRFKGYSLEWGYDAEVSEIHRLFPTGLYGRYLERGHPRVGFKYSVPPDLQSVLRDEIYDGLRRRRFKQAAKLANLFFGEANAPTWVDNIVVPLLMSEKGKLDRLVEEGTGVFADRNHEGSWASTATDIISQYEILLDLESIMQGKIRADRSTNTKRFGVSPEYMDQMRLFSKHTISKRVRRS